MFPGHTLGQTSPSARWRAALGVSSRNRGQIFTVSTKNALAAEPPAYISTPIKISSHTAVPGRTVSVLLIEQSLKHVRACCCPRDQIRRGAARTSWGVGPLARQGHRIRKMLYFRRRRLRAAFFCVGTNCLLCSREHLARKAAEHSLLFRG